MNKFLVLVANGNETIEIFTVVDYLRRIGVELDLASVEQTKELKTSQDISFKADIHFSDIKEEDYMGVYIPGGTKGAYAMRDNEKVLDLLRSFNDAGKIIGAICAGPVVLNEAGILSDKKATSFPTIKEELKNVGEYIDDQIVVTDGNITTGRGAAVTNYLALRLVEIIKGEAAKEDLKYGTQHIAVENYFGIKF